MNDPIQQEIEAKGLHAPRVTPADIEAEIASEHYFTALDGVLTGAPIDTAAADALSLLTFCVLVLKNGFTVSGQGDGTYQLRLRWTDSKGKARELIRWSAVMPI